MSRKMLKISEGELKAIKEKKKEIKEVKIYRRLLFLEMKAENKLNKEISVLLDVSIETLSHWTSLFESGGLDLLCELQYEGRRKSILAPFCDTIKKHVLEEKVDTLKVLQQWIKSNFEIEIGISWLHEYCKKNSIYLTRKLD